MLSMGNGDRHNKLFKNLNDSSDKVLWINWLNSFVELKMKYRY